MPKLETCFLVQQSYSQPLRWEGVCFCMQGDEELVKLATFDKPPGVNLEIWGVYLLLRVELLQARRNSDFRCRKSTLE